MNLFFKTWLENTGSVFYWVPSDKKSIEIGWMVPPRIFIAGDEYEKVIEEMFELVRKQVAPMAPSRLDAIFLCPTIHSAFYYKKLYKTSIYEVGVENITHSTTTDGDVWGDTYNWTMKRALYAHQPLTLEEAYDRGSEGAREYWLGKNGVFENPEFLVDPKSKVVILKQIN